ncbi:hypothetical protein [Streptomyces sp. NRRL F-5635]|uniref:hypothetical protein n=1 Tax=Streptomyces TaxID=1883 RepID=UPI0004CD1378|nr:hypothetical protein [Streptomyces sp. NRRL F-5635]
MRAAAGRSPPEWWPDGRRSQLWRHDPTKQPDEFGNVLVSCTGSLAIVNLPVPGEQLALQLGLDADADEDQAERVIDTVALF